MCLMKCNHLLRTRRRDETAESVTVERDESPCNVMRAWKSVARAVSDVEIGVQGEKKKKTQHPRELQVHTRV